MAAPDQEEKLLLLEFRKRILDLPLTDLEQNDIYLVSWIRARERDLKKAEEMLRKHFEWRATNGVDTLLETWEAPSHYHTRYSYEITGQDDQGCPIVVCRFGSWNVKQSLDDGEQEIFLRYLVQVVLRVRDHVKNLIAAHEKFISQFVLILDMMGFSYSQLASIKTVETYMKALNQFESNYPETLKIAYVVNANKFAVLGYNLVKQILSARTVAKVEMYDSNVTKWKSAILSRVPQHALPAYYGGTQDEAKIQKLVEDSSGNGNDVNFTVVTVDAGSQFKFETTVEQPCTVISWKFKTRKHDIGFSVRYNDQKEIVSYTRFDAGKDVQENSLLCDALGKYSLIFDNKYSRFRSKILEYCVTVENGNQLISEQS